MNVLLDTHVLLWALYDSSKLSQTAKEAIILHISMRLHRILTLLF